MAAQTVPRITPEEYLERERRADTKSEYVITLNIGSELRLQLRGEPCRAYVNDMRVQSSPTACTYPDVVVVCGERKFADTRMDTLTNPTVLIEALSPSTEAYDRGEKFALSRRLQSLTDHVLVSQTTPRLERFGRQDDGKWLLTVAEGLNSALPLRSLDCTLALAAVCENVDGRRRAALSGSRIEG